jgi:hypothetical protein
MNRNDGLIGQRQAGIEIADRLGVPSGDLAEKDVSKHGSGQPKLSWPDTFQVHHRHHAADDDWKLDEARSIELVRTQRRIGGSEVHCPALDLPDAGARPYGLVADLDAGLGLVGFRPFGQDRIHKR